METGRSLSIEALDALLNIKVARLWARYVFVMLIVRLVSDLIWLLDGVETWTRNGSPWRLIGVVCNIWMTVMVLSAARTVWRRLRALPIEPGLTAPASSKGRTGIS